MCKIILQGGCTIVNIGRNTPGFLNGCMPSTKGIPLCLGSCPYLDGHDRILDLCGSEECSLPSARNACLGLNPDVGGSDKFSFLNLSATKLTRATGIFFIAEPSVILAYLRVSSDDHDGLGGGKSYISYGEVSYMFLISGCSKLANSGS